MFASTVSHVRHGNSQVYYYQSSGVLDWVMALGRIRKFITVPFGTLILHKPHTHTHTHTHAHTNARTHMVETLKLQLILILVQIKFLFKVNATNLCQGIMICSVSV